MDTDHPLHLMHIFPEFGPGGAQLRVAGIINGIGPQLRHTILALNGDYRAGARIRQDIQVQYPTPPTGRGGLLFFRELQHVIRKQSPGLLLTYNWGAIDAVFAAHIAGLCPIVHNECGFGAEESRRLKTRRVVARRLLLNRIFTTVVTSRRLQTICLESFRLHPSRVKWIRTGVDLERFRPGLSRQWRAQFGVAETDFLVGFVGALRPEKNLELLLRAFAQAQIPAAKLVLIGDGSCRAGLEALAGELAITSSVCFAGHQTDPAACLPALDLFALSSSTEQTSNALLEAMACGLPAIATDVGDSRELLGEESAAVVPGGDVDAFSHALAALAASPVLRARLASANRDRCVRSYSLGQMIAEYSALYYSAAAQR